MSEPETSHVLPKPLVSVVLITYNHAPYIERAIESILEQETSFPVEVLISDDHSTDATREIIDRVVARYQGPHMLIVRHRNPNLGRLGMNNFVTTIAETRGRYVALLEGDDYWTARDKLATQVAVLETHPNVTMAGHRTDYVLTMKGGRLEARPRAFEGVRHFQAEEVLRGGNIIHTSSMMFRNDCPEAFLDFLTPFPCGDLPTLAYHAIKGMVAVDSRCMSHSRRTGTGLCSSPTNTVMADIQLGVYERLLANFPSHAKTLRGKVAVAQVMKASSAVRLGAPVRQALSHVASAWRHSPTVVLCRLPLLGKMLIRTGLRLFRTSGNLLQERAP